MFRHSLLSLRLIFRAFLSMLGRPQRLADHTGLQLRLLMKQVTSAPLRELYQISLHFAIQLVEVTLILTFLTGIDGKISLSLRSA